MNRSSRSLSLLLITLLLAGLFCSPAITLARPALPQTDGDSFTLEQLNTLEPIALNGPLNIHFVNFGLPADWALSGGARLNLTFDTAVPGFQEIQPTRSVSDTAPTPRPPLAPTRFGGNLRVVMNNVPLAVVPLNANGSRTLSIPIPSRAFSATQANGQHYLAFQLDDQTQCGRSDQTFISIDPQTSLAVPHRTTPLKKDLTKLPRPIYQHSFVPDEATLVVPDNPTALELQAALNVSAGFGRMTGGGLALTLTTASQLSATVRAQTHLILIGTPAGLPMIKDIKLPLALAGAGFDQAQPDNGVLQLADSPWNAAKAVLIVSGETDAGVATAAKALSTGNVRASKFTDFALIQPGQNPALPAKNLLSDVDVTLEDLGYTHNLLQGGGSQTASYIFSLPEGQVAANDSYVEVAYVHSALLDYARSNLSVVLNGVNIGSIRVDDNSTRLSRARISLPPDVLRAGENHLIFRSEATHRDACVLNGSGLWLNIQSDTQLHIVTRADDSDPNMRKVNLNGYLGSLTSKADLSNLAFVLGAKDVGGWNAAVKLAVGLGAQINPLVAQRSFDMVTAYSNEVPDEIRTQRNMVVVGKATGLTGLMDDLNKVLPAPFPQGQDVALERDAALQYRVPAEASIGYVQLLVAPWNARRSVLAVMGSNDEGILSASAALVDPKLRDKISGNLVFVNGDQLVATDNQKTLARAIAADTAAQPAASLPPAPPADVAAPPWIFSVVIVTAGILLLIAAVIAMGLLRRGRRTVPGGSGNSASKVDEAQ